MVEGYARSAAGEGALFHGSPIITSPLVGEVGSAKRWRVRGGKAKSDNPIASTMLEA